MNNNKLKLPQERIDEIIPFLIQTNYIVKGEQVKINDETYNQ